MTELSECRALITGGLGTIGRAMATRFAEAGVTVTVLDRPDAEDGPARAAALGQGVGFFGCDLNDLKGAEAAVRRLAEEVGGFDILINNAALIINKPHEDFSLEEYEDQIRVNSSAAFALTRAASPHMKAQGYGRIVNLTSVTLVGQWDGYVPYVASKGAMLGLTKGLARELGPHGITVNAIAPGAVVSEAEERVFGDRLQEYNDWIIERQCLKTRIEPRDVADLALFLCSPAARTITSQNVGIDGGW
jgi:NAD(P)-dependent dehydrogenase (short-subunit alcohol dehydrogenase family)